MNTLEAWSHRGTILAAFVALVALPLSAYWTHLTLEEVRTDRAQQQAFHKESLEAQQALQRSEQEFATRPYVVFPFVGNSCKVVKLETGGIDLASKESETNAPRIKNLGRGRASNIKVVWRPEQILPKAIADTHPKFLEASEIPARPAHLASGEMAGVFMLPACFHANGGAEIEHMIGVVEIKYSDEGGREYSSSQRCTIWFDRKLMEFNLVIREMPRLPSMLGGFL